MLRVFTFCSLSEGVAKFAFDVDGIFEIRNSMGVLTEKLIVPQPIKELPAFYGTKRFIMVFTRSCHWSLS
jgi:hypothetical protein